MDHWGLALRFPQAEESKWVVPRQAPLGPQHVKFAERLYQKGNLLIWPQAASSIHTRHGVIWKLPAHTDRNRSGLVMTAASASQASQPHRTLMPGDARYDVIPAHAKAALTGLCVTHHGGNYRGDSPPAALPVNKCAYSFAVKNEYGHPKKISEDKHVAAGWKDPRNTPDGNVCLGHLPVLPQLPPCGGSHCSLSLDQ